MKKNLNHSFPRLWAFALTLALLLSGCGANAGATQGGGGSPEPSGQDTEEGWKPEAPVNFIVAYAPGGGTDIMARAIAQYIDLDGQTMYVTNVEGGGGTIGAMETYHSKNDGLTLSTQAVEVHASSYVSGALQENLCEEMTWIACVAKDSYVISVAAGSPYETLEDVIAAAKANPGGMTLAGAGTALSRGAVLALQRAIGVEFNYVPHDSGAKARTAVLGGHEDLLISNLSDMKTYADSGELRILAIELEERSELVPDVPTFKELGYDGLFSGSTRCIMLPPDTDEEIARYYETKLKEVLENEEFQSVMRDTLGLYPSFTGMDGMQDIIDEATEWAEEYVPLTIE